VVAAAVAAGLTLALYQPGNTTVTLQVPGSNAVPHPAAATRSLATSGNRLDAVNKVEAGLVIINTQLTYNSEAAAGTGMIINKNGLILTNNHVIREATRISATVALTGKTYQARVVGYDKVHDVGLIQLEGAPALRTVPIGNSATVRSGDPVVALGNAQGQGGITLAGGRITALNQSITASDSGANPETLHGMLRTDAHIQPGDSGGPLVGAGGGVIGMDTAGNAGTFGLQQGRVTGFAIPINTALGIARQIAGGHANSTVTVGYPPFIGVFIAPGSSSNPQRQEGQGGSQGKSPFPGFPNFPGFPGSSGNTGSAQPSAPHCSASQASVATPSKIAPVNRGTLVEGTICGSPADAVGLTSGSVITSVNGQSVGAPRTLGAALAKYHPGETISIAWVSPSGQHHASNVRLTAGPPQ
jgi:S1-C subfamily serine protease